MKNRPASELCNVRVTAAFLTLLVGLVIVTPICGLLFQCKCDWPWLEFYYHCNYFNADVPASHKCPWCISSWVALGSIGTAFVLAALAALFLSGDEQAMTLKTIAIKVAFGVAVFMLLVSLSAALAARSQHYPLGIGGLFAEKEPVYTQ